jgi:hypothetical protein
VKPGSLSKEGRQRPMAVRRAGLWRQLPAGTEGAYQLLANLISLPKAPPTPGAVKTPAK